MANTHAVVKIRVKEFNELLLYLIGLQLKAWLRIAVLGLLEIEPVQDFSATSMRWTVFASGTHGVLLNSLQFHFSLISNFG